MDKYITTQKSARKVFLPRAVNDSSTSVVDRNIAGLDDGVIAITAAIQDR